MNYTKPGMKKVIQLYAVTLTLLSLLAAAETSAQEDIRRNIEGAYLKLLEAERQGANVTDAALKLNKALTLLRLAETNPAERQTYLKDAGDLTKQVYAQIPTLIAEGRERTLWRNLAIALSTICLAGVGVFVYAYWPKIFWNLWIRLRKDWIVKTVPREKPKPKRGGGKK